MLIRCKTLSQCLYPVIKVESCYTLISTDLPSLLGLDLRCEYRGCRCLPDPPAPYSRLHHHYSFRHLSRKMVTSLGIPISWCGFCAALFRRLVKELNGASYQLIFYPMILPQAQLLSK